MDLPPVLKPSQALHEDETSSVTKSSSSWLGRKLGHIKKAPSVLIEIFRRITLSPAKSQFLAFLDSQTAESRRTFTERANLYQREFQATPIDLTTSEGIPIKAMYFQATTTTVEKLRESYKPQSTVDIHKRGESGPTVILCCGSDTSCFAESNSHAVKAFLARGINVIIFDYPGVGLSDGQFSVKKSYDAAESVYQHLIQTKHVPNENLLVEGYSMGSGPATWLASKHPHVNVLLRFPFVRMSEIGVEALRSQFSGTAAKIVRTLSKTLEHIARFALPYDNEALMPNVQGHVGVMIASAHDMYDEELRTRSRLISAATQSAPSARSFEIADASHETQYHPIDESSKNLASTLDRFLKGIDFTEASPTT